MDMIIIWQFFPYKIRKTLQRAKKRMFYTEEHTICELQVSAEH